MSNPAQKTGDVPRLWIGDLAGGETESHGRRAGLGRAHVGRRAPIVVVEVGDSYAGVIARAPGSQLVKPARPADRTTPGQVHRDASDTVTLSAGIRVQQTVVEIVVEVVA